MGTNPDNSEEAAEQARPRIDARIDAEFDAGMRRGFDLVIARLDELGEHDLSEMVTLLRQGYGLVVEKNATTAAYAQELNDITRRFSESDDM